MQRVNGLALVQFLGTNKNVVLPRSMCLNAVFDGLQVTGPFSYSQVSTTNNSFNCMPCHGSVLDSRSISKRHFSTSQNLHTPKVDPKKDYFAVLGVTTTCSPAKVKAAFYRLSKIHHPDINKSQEAVEKFHELSEAHEILTNKRLRQQYEEGRRLHVHHGRFRGSSRTHHPGSFHGKGPMQKAKMTNYDYDDWIDKHYTSLFAESMRQRERAREASAKDEMRQKQIRKEFGALKFPFGFLVTYESAALAAASIIALVLLFIQISKTD